MNKKIILTLILFLLFQISAYSYYDMSTPVEGNSIANNTLQFRVIENIYEFLSPKYPLCSDFSVKNTQVLHYPYDVKKKKNKYVSGYWKELWVIDICGLSKQVPVTFNIKKKKTDFSIDSYFLE